MKENLNKLTIILISFYIFSACMQGELIVQNGSGSGIHTIGESINITAISSDQTQKFYRWEGSEASNIDDLYSPITTIQISKNINRIEAIFIPRDEVHDVTVVSGKGNRTVSPGTLVTIRADLAEEGYEFYTWIGDIKPLSDSLLPAQKFHMPRKHVRIEATYRQVDFYQVLIINGIGNGKFKENKQITINAIPPNDHSYFSRWTGDTYLLTNDRAAKVTFLMPNSSVYLEAIFTELNDIK